MLKWRQRFIKPNQGLEAFLKYLAITHGKGREIQVIKHNKFSSELKQNIRVYTLL